jgi:hypothetical protein
LKPGFIPDEIAEPFRIFQIGLPVKYKYHYKIKWQAWDLIPGKRTEVQCGRTDGSGKYKRENETH